RANSGLDRLYLKQFREERSRTIGVLVDTSASLNWGEGEHHKGLYARQLAAALAWIGLGHAERMQVFALHDTSARALPAPSVRAGAMSLFRAIENVEERDPLQLVPAVTDALRQLRGTGP